MTEKVGLPHSGGARFLAPGAIDTDIRNVKEITIVY
jgi:hypothetical protein